MHILEGYLPLMWCLIWFALSIIVMVIGIIQLKRLIKEIPEIKKFLAINGVVMFFVSFIGFPAIVGCPTTLPFNALSGSFLGPGITSVVVAIVLLLQAFLLGYGGLTTLGANIFAMGVVGPLAACVVYHFVNKTRIPSIVSLILAVIFANIFSILTTAIQMSLVFGEAYVMVVGLFVMQLPLIVLDIIITVIMYIVLMKLFKDSEIFSIDFNDFFKLR